MSWRMVEVEVYNTVSCERGINQFRVLANDGSSTEGSLIESNKVFGNGDGVTYFDLYDDAADDTWLNNKYGTASLP